MAQLPVAGDAGRVRDALRDQVLDDDLRAGEPLAWRALRRLRDLPDRLDVID